MAHLPAVWRKSNRSGLDGCVEVAFTDYGQVALRDSKDRTVPVLVFTHVEWRAFIGGEHDREFEKVRKGGRHVAA